MACRRWSRRRGSLPALAAVVLLLLAAAAGSPDRPAPARPPLVLPLTLSYPNASRLALDRRGLGDAARPNARMRLHDDLLTNGYYTTRLYIGTPPQEFALIVDSGSTVTYVPCSTCEQCGNHQGTRKRIARLCIKE